eukprot:TRINITY_DN12525_c0_g1_i1.p2 TRINITY_DN12525_c0_g1~~TRINITY_DN12525_c0_g1_i1.p2  ORF type:complete len:171 (+),score=13.36 TRINITY_DN12525_c0_g1_i1:427-939(+)
MLFLAPEQRNMSPFLLQDRTARDIRVPQEAAVTAHPNHVVGIAALHLSVRNLREAVALFGALYTLPAAQSSIATHQTQWRLRIELVDGQWYDLVLQQKQEAKLEGESEKVGAAQGTTSTSAAGLSTTIRYDPDIQLDTVVLRALEIPASAQHEGHVAVNVLNAKFIFERN